MTDERVAFVPIKCWCGGDVHWNAGYRLYRCQYGHTVAEDRLPPFMRAGKVHGCGELLYPITENGEKVLRCPIHGVVCPAVAHAK